MKKICSVILAFVVLLSVAACSKEKSSDPSAVDFEFATEARDERLPAFSGDITTLMNNYYMEANFAGKTMWAAGINGNFYLSEPTTSGASLEFYNIFSKNCTSSFYTYLYEHYTVINDGNSIDSINENADEVIGRKVHKIEFSSQSGNPVYICYVDAEYGFCLKILSAINPDEIVFEVTKLKIGNVKYDDLEWEELTADPSETTIISSDATEVIHHTEVVSTEVGTIIPPATTAETTVTTTTTAATTAATTAE